MRKHLSYYTKGLENSSKLRAEINKIEHKEELIKLLKTNF